MSVASVWHRLRGLGRHVSLSVLLGVSLIGLVWTVTVTRISVEGHEALQTVERTTENMSRVLEESVVRTVSEVDKTLLFLEATFLKSGSLGDLKEMVHQAYLYSDSMLQISVLDSTGHLAASNAPLGDRASFNFGDREHFRVHADGMVKGLFIGKTVMGRLTRKRLIPMSRRLQNVDGSFAGAVVALVDPVHIAQFFRALDIGPLGSVALIGLDGVVRAGGVHHVTTPGLDLRREPYFTQMATALQGTLTVPGRNQGPMRTLAFRRVGAYPLIVAVAMERPQLTLKPSGKQAVYLIGSMVLTLVVLVSIAVSLRHQRGLEAARQSLVASEGELRNRSRELQITLDNMTQGIIMVDPEGNVAVINKRLVELLDIPDAFLVGGFTYKELLAELDRRGEFDSSKTPQHVVDYVRGMGRISLPVFERERPNGTVLEIRTTDTPDGGFVRTFTDVTERRRSEAQIVHLARHDPLTGLANRMVFREALERAISETPDHFAVHCLDLDRFKNVNDTAGHPVGDRLLRMVAKRILAVIREGDLAARLGGDEFAIIQKGATDAETAGALASRLCRRLSEPYEIDGKSVHIGASVGIVFATGQQADAVLKAGDLALYAAKSEGRGTYRFFDPEMNARFDARRELENSLRLALEADQLEVHYQPKIDVATLKVTGFEALLRWTHPQRGAISPSEFVPIAEDIGLIIPMGAWVLERACTEVARLPGNLGVAVNLSSAQFRDGELVATVERVLAISGLDPTRLELEITETLLLEQNSETIEQLYALRKLGVRVSLDDFGTGYSSLSYLLSFPFDRIKIDRSFVRQLASRGPSVAIVRAIVGLARSLGIATTAEGVESSDDIVTLRALGCTEAQGYAFGRPERAAIAFAALRGDATGSTVASGDAQAA